MKNRHILEQLEDVLRHPEKRLHEEFNYATFNDNSDGSKIIRGIPNCGTSGCAAGELPGLDPDWYFDDNGEMCHKGCGYVHTCALRRYFNLFAPEIAHIFFPNKQNPDLYGGKELGRGATPEEVADNIREFLEMVE